MTENESQKSNENIKVVKVVDSKCIVGENPLWHPDESKLYWVDIPQGQLMRYDPAARNTEIVYESDVAIGGFTIQKDGSLLLFMERGAIMRLDGSDTETIIGELPEELDTRFNDVIADPYGRVFCGTLSSDSHQGRLYRLETDGSIEVVQEGIGTSNGMGFTPDGDGFYHTDTRQHTIYLYDYDGKTGRISNRRAFVHIEGEGRPDGMTVDREGYVWSALWEGKSIVRFTPDGAEDIRVSIPARKVSCLTFGGQDYSDIYVTTAGGDDRDAEGPGAGALFRVETGIRGTAEFRSCIQGRR
jgi:D-xylonolactonase